MGKFSRDKGKRGERAFCLLCREEGYDVHRTSQYCGQHGTADVEGLPGFYVECKNVERLNLRDAMTQAVHDCDAEGEGNIPLVAHKRNNMDWLITLRGRDFFKVIRNADPQGWISEKQE